MQTLSYRADKTARLVRESPAHCRLSFGAAAGRVIDQEGVRRTPTQRRQLIESICAELQKRSTAVKRARKHLHSEAKPESLYAGPAQRDFGF